ncbi:MAG: flagella basal body P-ring formation protein FlgA [Candidatus Melainabacteria bacterium]|nr:MAG: flagella basal body P-ring formation protein FlgA [Candidatus Melainabacteria bacterium]
MIRLISSIVIFYQLFCFPVFAGSKNVLLAHREPAVTGTQPIGNLVVAKRRILSKATVLAGDVQLMQADSTRIPDNAYKKVSSVVGKIARYDIEPGSILGTVDLQQASRKLLKQNSNNSKSSNNSQKNGMVVWTRTAIKKKTKITSDMITLKPMAKNLIPDSAIGLSKLVVGQRPDHDLFEGQIIYDSDIINFPWLKVSSVFLVNSVAKGDKIRKEDVYEANALFNRAVDPGPSKASSVIGKKARTSLWKDHDRLTDLDICP